MKKLFLVIFIVLIFVAFPVSAQMMQRDGFVLQQNSDIAEEEAKGRVVWERLQSGIVSCENLSDEDYELLGEYFMGQWAGSSHAAMNQMMIQMMGESGEEQMHVALGKRQSGCDLNAQLSSGRARFMPIVETMQNFRGGWFSFIVSLIFTFLLWFLIISGIIILLRWIITGGKDGRMEKENGSAMRIIKERYAKGEISKDDFESMKKDLQ